MEKDPHGFEDEKMVEIFMTRQQAGIDLAPREALLL